MRWERFEPCRAGDCHKCVVYKPGGDGQGGVYCSCECHGSEDEESVDY